VRVIHIFHLGLQEGGVRHVLSAGFVEKNFIFAQVLQSSILPQPPPWLQVARDHGPGAELFLATSSD